jgi:tape measure domain-containing protein
MAGSSRFSIEAVISMIDKVSGPMANANRSVSAFSGKTKSHFGGIGSALTSAMGMLGVAGGGALIYMGMKKIVSEAMNIESAVANFTTLLGGSEVAAGKLVNRLQVMGAATPFEFKDLAALTQILLPTMKGDIDKVITTLGMLGDTAGGNFQKLETITRGFNKAMLKGKPDLESLNMIGEAGVPIFDQMAMTIGVTTQQIFAMSKAGTLTNDQLIATFKKMTSAGGLFFEGMLRSSKTTSGLWSTFKDAISMTASAIGQELLPTIKEVIISMTKIATQVLIWVQNNKQFIADLVDNIKWVVSTMWRLRYVILFAATAWGVYKVAVIASTLATKGLVAASAGLKIFQAIKILGFVDGLKYLTLGTKFATVTQWLFNASLYGCPVIWIIAGLASMAAAIYLSTKYWNDFGAALTLTMGPVGVLINGFKTFESHWGNIKQSFETGGIISGLNSIGMALLDMVLYPLQQILQLVGRIPGMGWATSAANSIKGYREGGASGGGESQFGSFMVQPPATSGYASPRSNAIASGVETKGNVDINVYAPKGAASVTESGTMPRGTQLNKGYQ